MKKENSEYVIINTFKRGRKKTERAWLFLNNKGTDNFSARILTVNGKVTAAQHRAMADAAETFGNGILTFTTRQTVEVQGIPYWKNWKSFRSLSRMPVWLSVVRALKFVP